MTDTEILNRYCEKECKDYLQCGYSNKEHCPFHKGIKYGLTEGRKENEINATVANDFHNKNLILEKENEELKEQNKKMRNHLNCAKYHYCICKGKSCKDCKDWKMEIER